MLDTNAHDAVLGDADLHRAVAESVAAGKVVLVGTHVQDDELRRAPVRIRGSLSTVAALAQQIPTEGSVWDVSNWDQSTWTATAGEQKLGELMLCNPKHAVDVLIALTAEAKCDVLVTHDRRLSRKVRRSGSA